MQGGEAHIKDLLNQRWAMLRNEYFGEVEPMTAVTELELIEHGMWIDLVRTEQGLPRLSVKELTKQRKIFRKFCKYQWANYLN